MFAGQRTWEDLTGATLGFLRVLRLVSINPAIRYECECINCGTIATYDHVPLRDGTRCRNSSCSRIAEQRAAQMTRDCYRPAMKDFAECPPLDPRSFAVWEKMQAQRERNK